RVLTKCICNWRGSISETLSLLPVRSDHVINPPVRAGASVWSLRGSLPSRPDLVEQAVQHQRLNQLPKPAHSGCRNVDHGHALVAALTRLQPVPLTKRSTKE